MIGPRSSTTWRRGHPLLILAPPTGGPAQESMRSFAFNRLMEAV